MKNSIIKKRFNVIHKIGAIERDANNPFAKSKYCSLSKILQTVNPIMNEEGLLVSFGGFKVIESSPAGLPSIYEVIVSLCDIESDEKEDFVFQIPFESGQSKNPVQGFGSMTTYGQRYIYGVLFQIPFNDEDPDQRNPIPKQERQVSRIGAADEDTRPWLNKDSDSWNKAIDYLIGDGDISNILKKYRISHENKKSLTQTVDSILEDLNVTN